MIHTNTLYICHYCTRTCDSVPVRVKQDSLEAIDGDHRDYILSLQLINFESRNTNIHRKTA